MKKDSNYLILIGLIIGIGLLFRILVSIKLGSDLIWPDSRVYLGNARWILETGNIPIGKFGPLYSCFISLVFSIFSESVVTLRIVQAFMWIGTILAFNYISIAVFNNKRVSIITTVLLSMHPLLIYISGEVISESLYIFTYSLMLLLMYHYMSNRKMIAILFAGIFLGLATLTRSLSFLFMPFIVLLILFENKKDYYRSILHSMVFLTAFFIVIFPYVNKLHDDYGVWTIHGYGSKHIWLNTVYPLYGPIGSVIDIDKNLSYEQKKKVAKYTPNINDSFSFSKRNRLYEEAMFNYIRENPKGYVFKLFRKFLNIFSVTFNLSTDTDYEKNNLLKLAMAISLGTVYLTFIAGLVLIKNIFKKVLPLIVILFCSMMVFTIYTSVVRYTLSILPVMIIFASYAIDYLFVVIKNYRSGEALL